MPHAVMWDCRLKCRGCSIIHVGCGGHIICDCRGNVMWKCASVSFINVNKNQIHMIFISSSRGHNRHVFLIHHHNEFYHPVPYSGETMIFPPLWGVQMHSPPLWRDKRILVPLCEGDKCIFCPSRGGGAQKNEFARFVRVINVSPPEIWMWKSLWLFIIWEPH